MKSKKVRPKRIGIEGLMYLICNNMFLFNDEISYKLANQIFDMEAKRKKGKF